MAEQAPQVASDVAAQTAGDRDGPKLPGLPVRTSKGEKDMKDPKMVYGHNENLAQYAPITVRPANYSAHFAKESGQCKKMILSSFLTNKHIFLRCIGCFCKQRHPVSYYLNVIILDTPSSTLSARQTKTLKKGKKNILQWHMDQGC